MTSFESFTFTKMISTIDPLVIFYCFFILFWTEKTRGKYWMPTTIFEFRGRTWSVLILCLVLKFVFWNVTELLINSWSILLSDFFLSFLFLEKDWRLVLMVRPDVDGCIWSYDFLHQLSGVLLIELFFCFIGKPGRIYTVGTEFVIPLPILVPSQHHSKKRNAYP